MSNHHIKLEVPLTKGEVDALYKCMCKQYELRSLMTRSLTSTNINHLLKPINIDMIAMTKDKHHELQVTSA